MSAVMYWHDHNSPAMPYVYACFGRIRLRECGCEECAEYRYLVDLWDCVEDRGAVHGPFRQRGNT